MKEYRIYTASEKSYENELFYQMENRYLKFKYDANSFVLKKMPKLDELLEAFNIMKMKKVNECLKVRFPINQILPKQLESFVLGEGFSVDKLNLYEIKTDDFPQKEFEDIMVEKVTKINYSDFAELAFIDNQEFGLEYAKANAVWNKECFDVKTKEFYVAYKDKLPVGSLIIIPHEDGGLELDSFKVIDEYQNQGVGTALQTFVMQEYKTRELFLIADACDTPKDMYEKQGYQLKLFWYEMQKIY